MTPEERLRALRNPEEWTFRLRSRADAIPARRRWSPFAVSLVTIAAVAIVGVVVFSAFGLGIRSVRQPAVPLPEPTVTSSSSPSPSPSPTATQTLTQTPTRTPTRTVTDGLPGATAAPRPAQLFDGDCTAIYTEAELSQLTGEKMELYTGGGKVTAEFGGQLMFALFQAGGISCAWGVSQEGGGFSSSASQVNFFAVPASAVPALDKEETCGPPYSEGMYGDGMCGIEHVTGGIRFSGGVMAATAAKGTALSRSVIARLDERVAATDFTPTAPVAGAWSNPVDCDALAARIDVETVFGPGGDFGVDGLGHGSLGPPVGRELTSGYETLTCSAFARDGKQIVDSYRFGIMGGGGWVRDELGASTPVEVPGIGEAYKVGDFLYLFTGPNLITLDYYAGAGSDMKAGDYADAALPLRAVIAALDAM